MQQTVSQSSIEVEYNSNGLATQWASWLKIVVKNKML